MSKEQSKNIAGWRIAKDLRGVVHALNPLFINEYTLCGNAFDGDGQITNGILGAKDFQDFVDDGQGLAPWNMLPKGKEEAVTCPDCLRALEWCKSFPRGLMGEGSVSHG